MTLHARQALPPLAAAAALVVWLAPSCALDSSGGLELTAGGAGATGGSGGSGGSAGQGGTAGSASGTGGTGGTGGTAGTGGQGGTGGVGGGGGQGGTGGSLQTVDLQIAANQHDAWDDEASGDLDRCYFGDQPWNDAGGYQWSLPVPQGATVVNAHVRVYSTSHNAPNGLAAYTATLHVEDTDSAAPFTGAPGDIQYRTYASSTVDWPIPASGLPTLQWSDSPPITALVQHAVDRPGWAAGNMLSVAIWGTTGSVGCAEIVMDYSDDPNRAARLHVEFTP